MCSFFIEQPSKYNKNPIYLTCDTYGYEMNIQYFNSVNDFFENAIIEEIKIKDIWNCVEIVSVEGF